MAVWTAYLHQEGEDLILPIPDEVLVELNWKEGDILVWKANPDGTYTLSKQTRWYQRLPNFIKKILWR